MNPMDTLSLLVSLSLLAIVVLVLWPKYRVDAYRQDLFELRDELFDLACDGHLSFNEPAYAQLRTTINGSIRFANRFDLVSVILLVWFTRSTADRMGSDFEERWQAGLSRLPEPTAVRMQELRMKLHLTSLKQALASSPLLTPILLFAGLVVTTVLYVRAIVARAGGRFPARVASLKNQVQATLDAAAFGEGLPA